MRDDNLLLQDIIEAGRKILRFTKGYSYDDFMSDEKTRDAVTRNFEIIGEASGRISELTQQQYPKVEWRKMKAFRNLLIHQYFGVNYAVVWDVVENFLPPTIAELENTGIS